MPSLQTRMRLIPQKLEQLCCGSESFRNGHVIELLFYAGMMVMRQLLLIHVAFSFSFIFSVGFS